jgi:mono/diheme cytochrome c family protein
MSMACWRRGADGVFRVLGGKPSILAMMLAFAGCHKPSVESGALVFQRNCAGCHLRHPGQSVSAPSLAGYFNQAPRPSASETRQIIRHGRRYMPPFAARLSPAEIDDVIAYIRSLH